MATFVYNPHNIALGNAAVCGVFAVLIDQRFATFLSSTNLFGSSGCLFLHGRKACVADLLNIGAASPATFGFVAKYLPGKNIPSGNLEFQFNEGNLNFKSTSMDWLVVTGQPRARFHGIGTVNGTNICNFEVDAWAGSAQPGNLDAFGLKITGCASGGDRYILPATALNKGSIIIHK